MKNGTHLQIHFLVKHYPLGLENNSVCSHEYVSQNHIYLLLYLVHAVQNICESGIPWMWNFGFLLDILLWSAWY